MNELDFTNRTASILFRPKKSRIDCHFLSTKTPVSRDNILVCLRLEPGIKTQHLYTISLSLQRKLLWKDLKQFH